MSTIDSILEAASDGNVSLSFSRFHAALLDICFNRRDLGHVPTIEGSELSNSDLSALAKMVLVEFSASLEKEIKGVSDELDDDTSNNSNPPRPYDVFLMKTTWDSRTSNLAVCMPIKSKSPYLSWWDCQTFWPVEPSKNEHFRKVASLTGSARVLQAIHNVRMEMNVLSKLAMRRECLFDAMDGEIYHSTCTQTSNFLTQSLNESQRKAVTAVTSTRFQEGFFAIQGPPGCGKTTTLVAMIIAIGKGMIVTAPSNAAVANLALKLHATDKFEFGEMLVFGDGCDESVHFLNPRYRSERYKTSLESYSELIQDGNHDLGAERELQELAKWLHLQNTASLSMKSIGSTCPNIETDYETGSLTRRGLHTISGLLANAKVIFCTLNTSGSEYLRNAVDRCGFHTFMLDEGGQSTEAEFFIATTFPEMKRIIVMGDPMQLRPTVIDPDCARAGYGRSWLSEVYKLYPKRVHLLDTQYRMDPKILKFPNAQFYGVRIQSGENVLMREPPVRQPLTFVDTQGRGREEKDENLSYRNLYEVAVIKSLLQQDRDIKMLRQKGARVIIITPYKAQMRRLKQVLTEFQNVDISTVDAFQGQESEIVILSTVRTNFVGFVDDPHRINVALTRAKRVLRVVGDLQFFLSLHRRSTLRALAVFAKRTEHIDQSKQRALPFCPPDFSISTIWKITMTSRFHYYLRQQKIGAKNIILNTLYAIATPDTAALKGSVSSRVGWHTSFLKNYDWGVVWIARVEDTRWIVEAHFAGNRGDCLHFVQKHHKPPEGSCAVKVDMSGPEKSCQVCPSNDGEMVVSWPLNNKMKNAIIGDNIDELPLAMIQLDPPQEAIAKKPPPLMIESRSGTGKTLVLLQHAAFYSLGSEKRPACFVTVSRRLRNELQRKYEELTPIQGSQLPPTSFFSFHELLGKLIQHYQIHDFIFADTCTFLGYELSKKSYLQLDVEPHLIENEVGGVIMGSLVAAQQAKPLSRDQYLSNKRSNISNKADTGMKCRNLVYDEFERYQKWKAETRKYDVNDVVLCLLQKDLTQFFSSAYLDEVQDLSHASIYLICSLAGKDSLQWVCGGDPAQMISPGCSFTFDGLKQTLLAVQPGIEPKLREVHHLAVNYRTTKDILMFGNSVLDTAKKSFPGSIEFALPEKAKKDLGLKVVLCEWNEAFSSKAKFGDNQAFIFSPCDSKKLQSEADIWLDYHPFILSSLDSKGLEFDDVVVAFDLDRKVWEADRKLDATLRMLRELYVAVTRAQKRVVVLFRNKPSAMLQFFQRLECEVEIQEAHIILQEFDRDTTAERWMERANELFQHGHFNIAASCFTRANRQEWSFRSKGEHLLQCGLKEKAGTEFRRSAKVFFERGEFQHVLDLLLLLVEIPPWNKDHDDIFEESLHRLPNYLSREQVVRFAILRGKWDDVGIEDLKSRQIGVQFIGYRKHPRLKKLISDCSDDDRSAIEDVLPSIIGDYHFDSGDFFQASRVFLKDGACSYAQQATEYWLQRRKHRYNEEETLEIISLWKQHKHVERNLAPKSPILPLLKVFESPEIAAKHFGDSCLEAVGRQIIMLAVDKSEKVDRTCLIDFGQKQFKNDVDQILISRFEPYLTDVVKWYAGRGYQELATDFIHARLKDWQNDDMLRIVMQLHERPKWLFQELQNRKLLEPSILLVLTSPQLKQQNMAQFRSDFKRFNAARILPKLVVLGKNMLPFVGQEIEKAVCYMYMQDSNIGWAIEASMAALGNYSLAAKNVAKILRLWEEKSSYQKYRPTKERNASLYPILTYKDRRKLLLWFVKLMQNVGKILRLWEGKSSSQKYFSTEERNSSLYPILAHIDCSKWLLWFIKLNSNRSIGADSSKFEELYESFGNQTLDDEHATLTLHFGPTVAAYTRIHSKARHDEVLLGKISVFYTTLPSLLQQRRESRTSGPSKNGKRSQIQEASGNEDLLPETKVLSKKAKRKLRQQTQKASKSVTNTGGQNKTMQGVRGKRKNKKKKNNRNNKKR